MLNVVEMQKQSAVTGGERSGVYGGCMVQKQRKYRDTES